MNITKDVYDLEKAISLAGGNRELAIELITMLIAQLPAQKIEITESINNNDMTGLKQHIHKLHGSTQCCATTALMDITKDIQVIIENNLEDQFETSKDKLLIEIDRVMRLDTSTF